MQGVKSNTSYYLAVFYLLFSILIYFLDSRGALNFVHKGAQILTIPVRSALFDAHNTVLSPLVVFSDSTKKDAQMRELEERVASLSSQLANKRALEEENAKMRRLLGTNLPPNWQFSAGRVVSVSSDIMSVTSDYNAASGTPVLEASESPPSSEAGGVLVGRVEKVVGRQTQVTLPTNIASKIPVLVRGQDGSRRASGIVVGQGGTSRLEQVLASESLDSGDLILTSGDANLPAGRQGLPPELLVGFVDKVTRSETSPWQEAGVKSAINTRDLDFVFFVTKY